MAYRKPSQQNYNVLCGPIALVHLEQGQKTGRKRGMVNANARERRELPILWQIYRQSIHCFPPSFSNDDDDDSSLRGCVN